MSQPRFIPTALVYAAMLALTACGNVTLLTPGGGASARAPVVASVDDLAWVLDGWNLRLASSGTIVGDTWAGTYSVVSMAFEASDEASAPTDRMPSRPRANCLMPADAQTGSPPSPRIELSRYATEADALAALDARRAGGDVRDVYVRDGYVVTVVNADAALTSALLWAFGLPR